MSSDKKERTEEQLEAESESGEMASTPYLVENIKQLQTEIENLRLELKKAKGIPSGKIGFAFIILGVLSLAFSILKNSQVLAFIGLGLTFWGAFFFFISPLKYVRSSLLDSTATSSYYTIDRIVKDLKYEGKSYYIPPYPKEVYLPEYLKGLKDMIVFIPAGAETGMPSIEEMAKGSFLLKNPKGVCVAPPGLGLLTQIEKELRRDLTKLELNELYEILPQLIIENFQLAKEVEIKSEENLIHLRISDSTYKNLYSRQENLQSIHVLGCPLISAIVCAISKTAGKVVAINNDRVSLDGNMIDVWLGFVEG
ncbi:hypothetical protein HXY33_01610 [Candidatus Bathyarchaeota archaeon]|nr:hypothetical protein [Candidatus Bathyarchaeota archaeon]